MALHLRVARVANNQLHVTGEWEDGHKIDPITIPMDGGMTAAETVEFFMMTEKDMVAYWMWAKDSFAGFSSLHGQFTSASPHGKSYKEVTDSQAHLFDL